jgi:dihydrofolate synthase/folylpolyglutamate synthase
MDYNAVVDYLTERGNEVLNMNYRLENIRALLEALGNPHVKYPSVLIAGTNGKGSVAATITSILGAAGIRAGAYTSPHLVHVEERIALDGQPISQADFARVGSRVIGVIEDLMRGQKLSYRPTYFETITAMAFQYFSDQAVDLAVLEVGLGGRLDATNVVTPVCSIIVSISYDHQQLLGATIPEIAWEKAGIIKPNGLVISGCEHPEARRVIQNRSREMKAQLIEVDRTCRFSEIKSSDGRYMFDLVTAKDRYDGIRLALRGKHQIKNGILSVLAVEALQSYGFKIPKPKIYAGIESTRWPGRIDVIYDGAPLVLDGAHNVEAITALRDFLNENYGDRRILLIFGAMRDKDIKGLGEIIFPCAEHVILTRVDNSRSADPADIARLCAHVRQDFSLTHSAVEALALARSLAVADSIIVVAGSFYLVGDILSSLSAFQK